LVARHAGPHSSRFAREFFRDRLVWCERPKIRPAAFVATIPKVVHPRDTTAIVVVILKTVVSAAISPTATRLPLTKKHLMPGPGQDGVSAVIRYLVANPFGRIVAVRTARPLPIDTDSRSITGGPAATPGRAPAKANTRRPRQGTRGNASRRAPLSAMTPCCIFPSAGPGAQRNLSLMSTMWNREASYGAKQELHTGKQELRHRRRSVAE
jgi:hypothetical protein